MKISKINFRGRIFSIIIYFATSTEPFIHSASKPSVINNARLKVLVSKFEIPKAFKHLLAEISWSTILHSQFFEKIPLQKFVLLIVLKSFQETFLFTFLKFWFRAQLVEPY
ncbi:MAG: hypothetical protein A2622_00015 [Bdellovibrionales bacterium RIFCSPHIGHO2_01_FULL_40_29]|nr:MAG: hypothetical protein A2622_00015 [Bdellovibrionales bacterium RIFCSPHIGHO2_01_FULL_40_29]OFZ32512.1 MAG: hypothetical protein A3D17_04615 [Bdellovibrionales bacterium RIFCSPHIGHO2_02_FULL_40_15]